MNNLILSRASLAVSTRRACIEIQSPMSWLPGKAGEMTLRDVDDEHDCRSEIGGDVTGGVHPGGRVMAWDDFPRSRVAVLREPALPLDVAASIAGRAGWLRRQLPAIDGELGVFYPPIEIVPICWLNRMGDGTTGHVPGRVSVRPYQNGHRHIVQITAPSRWCTTRTSRWAFWPTSFYTSFITRLRFTGPPKRLTGRRSRWRRCPTTSPRGGTTDASMWRCRQMARSGWSSPAPTGGCRRA